MLNSEDNQRVTHTAANRPAGVLMRRYWQPIALVDELDPERPVVPVEVLGERLVAFKDSNGQYGLIDRHCPHRGADLAYGRCEDGGLRCAFHGWLFGVDGQCLEQPGEPIGSTFHHRVAARAYPVEECNGILFAWLGEGTPPPLPALDCMRAPRSHSFAFKGLINCNWLQALEVGIDPVHASFLHRYLDDEDVADGYGRQFRSATAATDIPLTQLLRNFPRPHLEVRKTDYGLRIFALRELGDGRTHVRVTNQVFPHAIVIPMSDSMVITQWHVPISDVQCYWYALFTSFTEPVDHDLMRRQRLELYATPGYVPRIGQHNDYGFDPREQRTRTYTGMGDDINVHDQWAVESMGAIADRTRENLARSDLAIRLNRQVLLEALGQVEAGAFGALPGMDIGEPPAAVDALGASEAWESVWREAHQARLNHCPWATHGGTASP